MAAEMLSMDRRNKIAEFGDGVTALAEAVQLDPPDFILCLAALFVALTEAAAEDAGIEGKADPHAALAAAITVFASLSTEEAPL